MAAALLGAGAASACNSTPVAPLPDEDAATVDGNAAADGVAEGAGDATDATPTEAAADAGGDAAAADRSGLYRGSRARRACGRGGRRLSATRRRGRYSGRR